MLNKWELQSGSCVESLNGPGICFYMLEVGMKYTWSDTKDVLSHIILTAVLI
jgi:hypothetical protein